jgi:AcrR family transcriptional regulator
MAAQSAAIAVLVLRPMRTREAPGQLDGNAIRTQRTRARILAEALRLFNERGEPQVTTGAIAEALGMSPGNLYYHFRNKDAIVEELFRAFERRIDVQPAPARAGAEAIEDLWLYLHLMLEAIQEHRFLYRNLEELLARNRRLRHAFARILDRKEAAVIALCDALVASGTMAAQPHEIRALARNVLVVATYWLNFSALTHDGRSRPGAVGEGAFQVMALVAPYLRRDARRLLDGIARGYLE